MDNIQETILSMCLVHMVFSVKHCLVISRAIIGPFMMALSVGGTDLDPGARFFLTASVFSTQLLMEVQYGNPREDLI